MDNESVTTGDGGDRVGPRVRLQLLGGLWARRPGVDGPAQVPEKPLAVLAYLLLARPRGVKVRDEVAGMFWPDADAGSGRRALRQAIHGVRQAFGADVVRSIGKHAVEVSPGLVQSDVAVFEAARECGDLETAMAVYQGEFMAGARLLNTGFELEEWVRRQREALVRTAAESATEMARWAAVAGDGADAGRWGRRALQISHHDEGVLRRLLGHCGEAGRHRVAMELWESHCAWLRRQGDLEPSPRSRAAFAELMDGRRD